MFTNPNTLWIEIIVVIAVTIFLGALFGRYLYRKKRGLPTGECACCSHSKSNLVEKYHKYHSKNN